MERRDQIEKNNFLFPHSRYYGQIEPETLIFNANLQEFSLKVSYICNLQTSGKLTSQEAYKKIKSLWKEFKRSGKQLKFSEQINK